MEQMSISDLDRLASGLRSYSNDPGVERLVRLTAIELELRVLRTAAGRRDVLAELDCCTIANLAGFDSHRCHAPVTT